MFSKQDTAVLRKLALRVKEAADRDDSQSKIEFWKRHTALKGERPAVFVYPDSSYNELIPWDSHECEDEYARMVEHQLRRVILQAEHIPDDVPILPVVTVEKVAHNTWWGVKPILEYFPTGNFKYVTQFETIDDWDKLSMPVITYDEEETRKRYESVVEAVGDILQVELIGQRNFGMNLIQQYCSFRNLDDLLYDLIEEPEMVHKALRFLTDGFISIAKQYEALNLVELNNNNHYFGSGGIGHNDELPGEDFDPNHVKLKNVWGCAQSQEFAVVSPAMHEEFALQYEREFLSLFGLNGYGCCEDLGKKLDSVLKIPNIRRIAVCPWADISEFTPVLQDKYIMTWKPQPAFMALGQFDPQIVEKELTEGVRKARGGRLELILRDTTTVMKEPERFTQWVQIARKAIAENWE